MANRTKRKEIASETLDIIKKGFYVVESEDGSDERKVISIKEDIIKCDNNTKVLDGHDWEILFEKYKGLLQWQGRTSKFEVTEEYSITCCSRLNNEGYKNITCLNFASAKNPCGGMINGSLAQEESLGLCSALYSSLSKQENHYEANKKDPKQCLYQDSLIYSPRCPVIRDDITYSLLECPFNVNFISCPAVNLSATKAPLNLVRDTMRKRAKAILSVAANEGCDALVLGAWGTGVFKNDVKDVVEYFKQYLIANSDNSIANLVSTSYTNVYPNQCLPTVVFAVGKDVQNQQAFKDVFLPNQPLH